MKRYHILLATALFIVACGGGNSKQSDESAEQQTKELAPGYDINAMSVEEVVNTYLPAMADAASINDRATFLQLTEEYDKWEDKIVRGMYYSDYCDAIKTWREQNHELNRIIDEYRIAAAMQQGK